LALSRVQLVSRVSIPKPLFHGTKLRSLSSLSVQACRDQSPFGPGIYLTADAAVARCYTGNDGAVLSVQVQGDQAKVMDLDRPIAEQAQPCQTAITMLRAFVGLTDEWHPQQNARVAIDVALTKLGPRQRNEFLASRGVWMLCGHLDGFESAGLQDRGVQYAVIASDAIAGFEHYALAPR
jgi:hypothetical protein